MNLGTRINHIILALFAFALVNCSSGKSKTENAAVTVNPKEPIVINVDASVGDDQKITGPWFGFSLSMTNNTGEKITILAIQVEVFGQNANGQIESNIKAITPADFDFQMGEDTQCKFTSFGTWETSGEGQTRAFELENGNPLCKRTPLFYIGSNPKGPNGNNFRYRVKLKPLGWFGGFSSATDRFDKTITFFTR